MDVLAAQVFHETGLGASMHNNNFGGIKGVSPEGMTARAKTREILRGEEVVIRDAFRAYSTPTEGAKDYLSFLERRFPEATRAAHRGDAAGFVKSLKDGRYFTADVGEYTAAVQQLMHVKVAESAHMQDRPPHAVRIESAATGPVSEVDLTAIARALDGSWTSFSRIRFSEED